MKKYAIIFLCFSVVSICYLSYPFRSHKDFVSMKNGRFFVDGNNYYPLVINYMASLQTDGKNIWPCAYTGYNLGFKNLYTTKDSCLMQLKADMDLIKEMGFNTIRLVGIGEESVNKKTGELTVTARIKNAHNEVFEISDKEGYDKYYNALGEILKIINDAGLKTIFLTRMSVDVKSTEDNLRRLVFKFQKDPSIMAYDFFNEPLYFDSIARTKETVYQTVKRWKEIVHVYAPHHLTTIGLAGIREVFAWDPNVIDVDFISLHPYEYEPDQVRNEIYWYGKNIKKPWIIGETAIPADNDSVSYQDQKLFARKTLKQTFDCNGQGYSWWQYKDVEWYSFHANFMGVVNLKGKTNTKKENITINGTVKPVVDEIKAFDPQKPKDSCVCGNNYYNYSQEKNKAFRITGVLYDENNKPINGGVVLAWNEWWSKSYHTVTKPDGSFELLSDFAFYHWIASATEYSMIRDDINPNSAKTDGNPIPTVNLGMLKVSRLLFLTKK